MRIRRNISSIPHRSAGETWDRVVALITGPESVDVQQLNDAAGVMASIITDEHPADRAIVLEGVGAQLRVYCRYGMKAVENGDVVDVLTWNPTAGDWSMHVPCDAENIDWVKAALSRRAPRIKVFDVADAERADDATASANGAQELVIDWNPQG